MTVHRPLSVFASVFASLRVSLFVSVRLCLSQLVLVFLDLIEVNRLPRSKQSANHLGHRSQTLHPLATETGMGCRKPSDPLSCRWCEDFGSSLRTLTSTLHVKRVTHVGRKKKNVQQHAEPGPHQVFAAVPGVERGSGHLGFAMCFLLSSPWLQAPSHVQPSIWASFTHGRPTSFVSVMCSSFFFLTI